MFWILLQSSLGVPPTASHDESKFARRWSVSAEGLMDVYRRDAFVREGLWTGIGHFSCSVVMHRSEPVGSTQMRAVRIAIDRLWLSEGGMNSGRI